MRFRPRVEALEAREVPAIFYWLGTYSTDATIPGNWSQNALPSSGDELKFGFFWPPTNPACTNLQGTFTSVEMDAYAPTTITLSGPLTIGGLIIRDGTIDQPSPGMDITVTFSLSWSGGTLNSTSNHALVNVRGNSAGATAGIYPNGATLTTGSTLSFEPSPLNNGTTAEFGPGTVQFNNGADLEIEEFCSAEAPTATDAQPLNLTLELDSSQAIARGLVDVSGWNSKLPLTGSDKTGPATRHRRSGCGSR